MCTNLMKFIIGSARSNGVTTATVNCTCKNLFSQISHTRRAESSANSYKDVNNLDVKDEKLNKVHNYQKFCGNSGTEVSHLENDKKQTHKKLNTFYIESQKAASIVATLISNDLLKNALFVTEINPGKGFLTRELLAAGVPQIHLFEENPLFHPYLKKLSQEFPNRIDIRPYNLYKLSKYIYIDFLFDTNNSRNVLLGVENQRWEGKSPIQIIGAIEDHKFLSYIMTSIVHQTDIVMYGRPILYLIIPTRIWKTYGNCEENPTTAKVVLFHTLFNYTHYGSIPAKTFSNCNSKLKNMSDDDKLLHVVKIEPKPELFTNHISKTDLPLFWHFVRHFMARKSRRIIPELEKFGPGCGVRLIEQNYNVFMEFGDLEVTEFLTLFKLWLSLKLRGHIRLYQSNAAYQAESSKLPVTQSFLNTS